MVVGKLHQLGLYETQDLFELQEFTDGVHEQQLQPKGNSVLSSVYIETIPGGGSVSVQWFQTTTGEKVGEEQLLEAQGPFSSADINKTDTEIVTKIHNKTTCRITVTGGPVRIGVYVTVVTQFASDLDSALQSHGDSVDLSIDKGIPIVCRNTTTGLWEFLECPIQITTEETGTPFHADGEEDSVPGGSVDVLSFTVPALTTRKLKRLIVHTASPGCYSLEVDGTEIASGIMHETRKNIDFVWDATRSVAAGSSVVLKYIADSTPTVPCPVRGYIQALDAT